MRKLSLFLILIVFTACAPMDEPEREERTEKPGKPEKPESPGYFPESGKTVTDMEDILTENQKEELSERIRQVEGNTGYEIVVVTAAEIPPEMDIVLYGSELGNRWDVGTAEERNGLVIVLSAELGQVGISAGKGLEQVFTDSVSDQIINNRMIPSFNEGRFFEGLMNALDSISQTADLRPEEGRGL